MATIFKMVYEVHLIAFYTAPIFSLYVYLCWQRGFDSRTVSSTKITFLYSTYNFLNFSVKASDRLVNCLSTLFFYLKQISNLSRDRTMFLVWVKRAAYYYMIQFWHTRILCLRQVFQTLWIERDSNSRLLAFPASVGRYHANDLRAIIPEAISLEYLLFQFWICATFFLKSVSIRAYLDLNLFFKEKCIFTKKWIVQWFSFTHIDDDVC